MKIKVKENAYYKDEYLKAGTIIDFKGKEMPAWATLADGIETKKEAPKTPASNPQKPVEVKTEDVEVNETKTEVENANKDAAQTEVKDADVIDADKKEDETAPEAKENETKETDTQEDIEYLNLLINEGIEKNILIDDADKKSVKEQIAELEEKLNKKGN